jgi:hypothetical protein
MGAPTAEAKAALAAFGKPLGKAHDGTHRLCDGRALLEETPGHG